LSRSFGPAAIADVTKPLITADAGGSNSGKTEFWSVDLAKGAGEIRLEIESWRTSVLALIPSPRRTP
jgi:hypothetical protein